MSGWVKVSRELFADGVFAAQPITEREALLWLALQGRIVRANVSDLSRAWNCADRRAAAIVKKLAAKGMISVHGEGASRTILITTPLVQSCGLAVTQNATRKAASGAGKWRGGSLRTSLRKSVMQRCGAVCAYCGDTEGPFHIDHIKPVKLGGKDDAANLTVACVACNLSKGAKTVAEWRAAK